MPTDHQVELANETLLLRPFRPEDSEPVYCQVRASLAEIGRWMPWCHAEYSLADTADYISHRAEAFGRDAEYAFVITLRASGQIVGGCGLNHVNRQAMTANLGYWLATAYTGRGYATQAARLTARFGLDRLGLQRIEIVAAIGNLPSQRVAERLKARRECVARNRLRIHDAPHDAVVYSLVPGDLSA